MATHPRHLFGLTSPHLHGPAVRERQQLLKRNWTRRDFLQGPADGEFGPETARACIRAKYWLGYPEKELVGTFGDVLYDLLTRAATLKPENRKAIAHRLKLAQQEPLRLKAFQNAVRDLGMTEHPANSNVCPISLRWGMRGPWCDMSVSEWYIDAGSKAFELGRNWAYVPAMLATAEHGEHGLAIIRAEHVLQGDILCFDWDRDGVPDHTGLFDHWIDRRHGAFATIEGNTALGNNSNGGIVMRRDDRELREVATYNRAPAFIRVGR